MGGGLNPLLILEQACSLCASVRLSVKRSARSISPPPLPSIMTCLPQSKYRLKQGLRLGEIIGVERFQEFLEMCARCSLLPHLSVISARVQTHKCTHGRTPRGQFSTRCLFPSPFRFLVPLTNKQRRKNERSHTHAYPRFLKSGRRVKYIPHSSSNDASGMRGDSYKHCCWRRNNRM